MSQADLDINRNVRTILVRHWIDLGRLSVRSSAGRLWITGGLFRITGIKEELTTPIVESIFADIKRVKDLAGIHANLENWTDDSGSWRPIGQSPEKAAQRTGQEKTQVYDVDTETGEK